ncbi:GntR family transcriptional regulator [Pseudonocardia acaciae]|uniref:GntR family transcriptional regulator n=1 Tax=Pseudonocardia acaciae TaxID=551276 RepID=UPI00048EAA08|nr:GntR family transcriptional regulator [Pseudonocardia acaciae]
MVKDGAGAASTRRDGAGTRAAEVYSGLRHDILRGAIRPNDRLIETDIAERLQVSRTPVREALQRLAADGLIVSSRRAWVVYQHSLAEIRHLYEARAALEGYAARLAAQRITSAEVTKMATRYHRSVARIDIPAKRRNDPTRLQREIVEVNNVFHDDVSRAASNPWILDLIQRSRSVYFNYEMARLYSSDELLDAFADHDKILDAIGEGDAELAEHIARSHVENGFRIIRERML